MMALSMVLLRWNAVDSAVDTVVVAVDPKGSKLSFEVKMVPEQYVVQQLFASRSDHAFDEGMGNRGVRNRLDLLDIEYA
jgi:hypothetical protein